MEYIKRKPDEPSFVCKGFELYRCNMINQNCGVSYIECSKGHDTIVISDCTHIYYVIEGNGDFEIDGKIYHASKNDVVEIPPHVDFTYTGTMKLLLVMNPPYSDETTKVLGMNERVK